MPGYQSKIVGTPPAPPYKCALCSLTHHEEIEYFIDTGVFGEFEGVVYLCSRCFEPLVELTEKFVRSTDHLSNIEDLDNQYRQDGLKLSELTEQAELLHDLFGLRLSDLIKFKDLTNKLDHLNGAVGLAEQRKTDRDSKELNELLEVQNRQHLISQLDAEIEARRAELDIFVAGTLNTKLEHIGRADLVDIILNNRLPESVTATFDSDERENDESAGGEISAPAFSV